MTEEMEFFIYLLEQYAFFKNRPTGEVLQQWDELGVTQKIYDGWWQYHQERIENAFEDIDRLVDVNSMR